MPRALPPFAADGGPDSGLWPASRQAVRAPASYGALEGLEGVPGQQRGRLGDAFPLPSARRSRIGRTIKYLNCAPPRIVRDQRTQRRRVTDAKNGARAKALEEFVCDRDFEDSIDEQRLPQRS